MLERIAISLLAVAGTLALTWAPIIYLAHMLSGSVAL